MNAFSRSWQITKITFAVINKDKELYAYPLIGIGISLVFILLMALPLLLSTVAETLMYVTVFVFYAVLGIINTYFAVCVVYTAKERFSGGDATIKTSMKFANSRFGAIIQWGLFNAFIALVIHAIESLARKNQILRAIISAILNTAWAVMTVFVTQAITFENSGPITSIKHSLKTVKQTWGESLIRYYGFGFIQTLAVFLTIVVGGIMTIGLLGVNVIAAIGAGILTVLGVVFITLTFTIAHQVYNTALYIYATTGTVPEGFDSEHIQHAFELEKRK